MCCGDDRNRAQHTSHSIFIYTKVRIKRKAHLKHVVYIQQQLINWMTFYYTLLYTTTTAANEFVKLNAHENCYHFYYETLIFSNW